MGKVGKRSLRSDIAENIVADVGDNLGQHGTTSETKNSLWKKVTNGVKKLNPSRLFKGKASKKAPMRAGVASSAQASTQDADGIGASSASPPVSSSGGPWVGGLPAGVCIPV